MPHRPLGDAELIELLFDCAESDGRMSAALAAMGERLGAGRAHALVLHRGRLVESYFMGADSGDFQEYEHYWQDKDPRFVAAAASLGRVLTDAHVMEPSRFEATPIYNELLRKHEVRHTLFTIAELGPELILAQAFMRRASEGAFQAEQVQGLTRLLPHLRRALRLRHLVQALRDECQDLHRALDVLSGAVAVLDERGRLVCANTAAERLLTQGDGVLLERGALTAVRPREAQALTVALTDTARWAEGRAGRSPLPAQPAALHVTRCQQPPLELVLMPLRPANELRQHGHRAARTLVVFHEPGATPRLAPDLVARLHGLTPTEALLAVALAQGESLAQFAASRGCSEQTARTHLKRVLDKTGTRRQADLVRVLLGNRALHRPRP